MNKDVLFGIHPVLEAINSGKDIDKILIQKNLLNDTTRDLSQAARLNNIPIQRVPIEKLNRVTRKNHQGVICFISPISFASLDQVISSAYSSGTDPLILALDRISDVRNFGAITRTAECLGVHAILVPEKGSAAINADAMKTSAGALNHIPVCRASDLKSSLVNLKENGLTLLGLTEKTNDLLFDQTLNGPVTLLMGSEEDGISPELMKICDHLAAIPLTGKISSLNVSVAAAIAISETIRQRTTDKK